VVGSLVFGGFIGTALAGEVNTLGPLQIDTPWARASIGTARPGAAYVTIRNTGDEADRLVSIRTWSRPGPRCTRWRRKAGL
jgi:copper(I)-binding protein